MFISNFIESNSGCYIHRTCVACIMYADDLMLISSSVSGLHKLLEVCALTSKELCLQFNDRKSHCMVIGPKYQCNLASLILLGLPLQWVDSLKYLGITFTSSRTLTLDINQTRRKFFGCVNLIINHCHGAFEMVKLHLMESYCYPIISYAIVLMYHQVVYVS